jgi:predicted Zn-dependent peptidase
VPARPVASANLTLEPPQRGERRLRLSGPVEKQYFLVAFPAPAASSPDLPAFLVLQQILSGAAGLNVQRNDWSATAATKGSLLFGMTKDVSTWLPPTRDPFLFMISGSIASGSSPALLEKALDRQVAAMAAGAVTKPRLEAAKAAVIAELGKDVETTPDAAHQLAFFEGIGALDRLLQMPQSIKGVTVADVQRIARTYLRRQSSTVGWMVPGPSKTARSGEGDPRPAADRKGSAALADRATPPELRILSGGLPAIVQTNPLSQSVTVELLLSGLAQGGTRPDGLPGLDAIVRSGAPGNLDALIAEAIAAASQRDVHGDVNSDDPATRLEQLIRAEMRPASKARPGPVAILVSGNIEKGNALRILERRLGHSVPDKLPGAESPHLAGPRVVRERISKPLSQGAIGYIVEGPPAGTREVLAWRMLLYTLTHDYSGRLGLSAIRDKGIVYHIYSRVRTDGHRTWASISTGVDPDKADAMEAELRFQISKLLAAPPSTAEIDAARNHILGRDLTAAKSNEEFTAKLAEEFAETGKLRSHADLTAQVMSITPAEIAAAARPFSAGTMIRVDVLR